MYKVKGELFMAKRGRWKGHTNCYSYAVDDNSDWLLAEDSDYLSWIEWFIEEYNLKPVSRKDVVLGKEYIAFRYCGHDFHFMRRNKQGYWRHKMGGTPVKAISTKKVFAESWYHPDGDYNSKLYLFEV